MSAIRRTPFRASWTVLAIVGLAACQKSPQSAAPVAAPADTTPAVATVNGTPISRTEYDTFVHDLLQGRQQDLTPEQKNQVLDRLIRMDLTAAQAEQEGLAKDPETAAQLDLMRLRVLEDAAQKKFMSTIEPTDAELHAEYDTEVAAMDKTEYKARHILVKSKDEADQLLKKLKGGAKFEDLAKQSSIDPSKSNGGDLGWFTTARMVKPFGDAVKELKKGEYTHEPVQTQFGWHLIQLEDTRTVTPPPFDQVKARIANSIKMKKWEAHIEDLEKQAKIEKKLLAANLGQVEEAFELGEVSFHSGWTFHRAGRNLTGRPREVMTVIYMDEFIGIGVAGVIERIRAVVANGPVYVSVDVDGFDPAYAPGTGTPEVGGLTAREGLALLRSLRGLDIVGADVVEVAPAYDASTNTAQLAAQLLFEEFALMALPVATPR